MKIVQAKVTTHPTKKYSRRSLSDITHIAIHHSATTSGSAEAFANYHVNTLGWPGIGYAYVIEKDGTIKQCHDVTVKSYHVGNSNKMAVGICLVGDFRVQEPTAEQWKSLYELTSFLMEELRIPYKNVWGHQEFPSYSWKPCPSLDMKDIRTKLSVIKPPVVTINQEKEVKQMIMKKSDKSPDVKTLQEALNKLGHDAGAADGIFGTKTESAVKAFQKATGLTVDGIVGPNTLDKIAVVTRNDKPVKESVEFTLGGKKYKISEI